MSVLECKERIDWPTLIIKHFAWIVDPQVGSHQLFFGNLLTIVFDAFEVPLGEGWVLTRADMFTQSILADCSIPMESMRLLMLLHVHLVLLLNYLGNSKLLKTNLPPLNLKTRLCVLNFTLPILRLIVWKISWCNSSLLTMQGLVEYLICLLLPHPSLANLQLKKYFVCTWLFLDC